MPLLAASLKAIICQAQFGFGPGRDCSTLQAAGNVDDDYRHGTAWFAPVYTAEYYKMQF